MLHTDVVVPVAELLARHTRERPDKIAFADDRIAVSYAALDQRTARLAGHLRDIGMSDGERLLMFLDNCVEVAEGYLVAPRAGVVTVCTNPTGSAAELEHTLRDSGATVVLTDSAHLTTVLSIVDGAGTEQIPVSTVIVTGPSLAVSQSTRVNVVSYDSLIGTEPSSAALDATPLDDWCWMLYTSGTTGRPKGVRLTQRGFLWVVAACWVPITRLHADDVLLSALPLFHSYALNLCVLGVVAVGATEYLYPKFSPRQVLQRLAHDGITFFPGVPTMFRYLMDTATGPSLDAPDLRICVSAGALMSPALNDSFEKFAQVLLLDGYGITETSTMVTMNSITGGRECGSCGLPLPGLTVRLVDPATGIDVETGQEGEIWVQGPNVMLGYHNLPEETSRTLTNGWYHTGDLARRDANGFLRISGRTKELIIRGGENIYPTEIEDVLIAFDSVADAAVVGQAHDSLGEVPIAFVVAAPDKTIDLEQLRDHCRSKLAYFKIPEEMIEVSVIPRTGSGKIQRHRLHRPGNTH